ncbi:MAG: DUF2149 domain-containing protein [Candidatus Muirbacterium halophilum]|nr:DUF2149 domain-containing protein [Candidatus Muirbacterium halophilum]MCK9475895.1 DUF2149 domain-containing protein [Candidatus Muirbacterium halophilum]
MRRNKRIMTNFADNDPLSGMANLFDVSMVFALALMVALVFHLNMSEMLTEKDATIVKNPGKDNMEIIVKKGEKITKYKASEETAGEGKGKKVGTAYQLENGEIIYIPE